MTTSNRSPAMQAIEAVPATELQKFAIALGLDLVLFAIVMAAVHFA